MTAASTVDELLERLGITRGHVGDLLDDLRDAVSARVEEVTSQRDDGGDVFSVVGFDDIAAATVDTAIADRVRRTGCLVVRGTFEREQAEAWNAELGAYLERNGFKQRLLANDPGAAAASRIWPVYWSRPQVAARQHARMMTVRRFLNHLWAFESRGERWFDPATDIGYPDRIRRREPGAVAKGLSSHADSPSVGGWRLAENQLVFAPLLTGGLETYDAFDAAHRTGSKVESPVGCTVFRTFQGWTALSDMQPDDGVLHVVPIPWAVGYRLVHGLAGELGLLGDEIARAPRRDAGDELLERAMVPIPAVAPGDTVWWHGDLYHSVGPATNDSRWGNVMYIGAAPRCGRNDAYSPSLYPRFTAGTSPVDFPSDDFEVDFVGRATDDDLDEVGRAQFGLA